MVEVVVIFVSEFPSIWIICSLYFACLFESLFILKKNILKKTQRLFCLKESEISQNTNRNETFNMKKVADRMTDIYIDILKS